VYGFRLVCYRGERNLHHKNSDDAPGGVFTLKNAPSSLFAQ
jgi:hypothetical protein